MKSTPEPARRARRFSIGDGVGALAVVGLVALAALQFRGGAVGVASGPHARSAVVIAPLAAEAGGHAEALAAAPAGHAIAVFAGGCFWGVQSVFQHTRGVLQAVSGYAGGSAATASYAIVGSGITGHAEAVRVSFDPAQISYAQLLQIFFSVVHDPTQLDRQGPDRGSQYRSALFYADAAQLRASERYIAQLDADGAFAAKIATRVEPLKAFYPAEAEHQDYATRYPDSAYIATFDAPKVANLKRLFAAWYRDEPVLVSGSAALADAARTQR